MAAARKLPSSDEVGVSMLEEMLRHGGKKRMRDLIEPPAAAVEGKPNPEELDIEQLEQLLATKGS